MLLKPGDTVLVAHRRLFKGDGVRFFIGRVDAYEAGVVKATGHSYTWDVLRGAMVQKTDERTKLLSLSSGALLVYQLPADVEPTRFTFLEQDGHLALSSPTGYTMNLAEFTHGGR
jgi:hypothetical protein